MAARDGNGSFIRSYDWTDDAANSIPITASRFDEEMDGIAAELTNSVAADGQTTMTGDLKLGGFKLTNVGDATATTDAPNVSQIIDNDFGYLGTTSGTSSDYTLTPSPAVAALAVGQEFSFTADADNTLSSGDTSLAISGLTATDIKKLDSSGAKISLVAGDIKNGITYKVRYDGTDFMLTDSLLPSASDSVAGVIELATDSEAIALIATNRAVTPANVNAVLLDKFGYNDYAESSNITITAGANISFSHGLGAKPKLVQAILVCTGAEFGYSVGDEVIQNLNGDNNATSGQGIAIINGSSTITGVFGASSNTFSALNQSGGGAVNLTNSNWVLKLRAWG
jgi:hypothetical protein